MVKKYLIRFIRKNTGMSSQTMTKTKEVSVQNNA